MQDDRYRIGETLRLIGKRLDQGIPMSETPDRIVELLRLLSEIDVPARGPKIEKTIKVERMRGAARPGSSPGANERPGAATRPAPGRRPVRVGISG